MNRALQWKLIAGFLLVFIAGGITGAFVGGSYARYHFFELHHPERIGGLILMCGRVLPQKVTDWLANLMKVLGGGFAASRSQQSAARIWMPEQVASSEIG